MVSFVFDCQVLEVHPPGKKVMSARDFWNGLRGQKLKLPQKAFSQIRRP